jgi:hypothetical protein
MAMCIGPVMQFPLESIQEFIISTQRFSAVNGRSEGAAVNAAYVSDPRYRRERWRKSQHRCRRTRGDGGNWSN